MSRSALITCCLVLALAGTPGAETWDCGESTAYSGAFPLDTDNSPCGAITVASATFKLDTEVSACTGWTVASADYLHDTVWSPGTIKKHPLGERVTLVSLPIARAFAQRFYIEAVDRSSGIGVMASMTADPGRLASVTGTITNVDGEIVLAEAPGLPLEVTLGDPGECPKPLGMNSCALRLGIGLEPTGILARVWGKAISVPEGETYYLVSDGGLPFAVLPEGVPRPDEGTDVILTGIPGVGTVEGQQVRVFRVNAQ